MCFKCGVSIGDDRRPFIAGGPDERHAVCLDCHMENDHPSCAICTYPLFEACVEFDDKAMHLGCFVCEKCKAPFPGTYITSFSIPTHFCCFRGKVCYFQG